MNMPDDAVLLDRYARTRDAEAFATLVERHAGLVYGTCLRQCGDRSLAEDASQECFLALATHAAEIRHSLAAWLHAVAVHAASRLGRSRREHAQSLPDAAALAPAVSAAWRDLEPHLDQALADLPQEERSAVILRYLEGQTQQQVAQTMGLSQATVSRRIASGITQLRSRLAQHLDDQAMGAALGCALVRASPALVAHAAKIGLAGIGAPAAVTAPLATSSSLILAASLTAMASLTLVLGFSPWHRGPRHASAIAPVMPAAHLVADPPAAVAVPAILSQPITGCVHDWPLDEVVDLIGDQLPTQAGMRLELMAVSDYPLVDLRCAATPLSSVLDQLIPAAGWRWRRDGDVVTIDRPLPAATLADLLAMAASSDSGRHRAAALALAGSGDLDACSSLLATLSGAQLDTLAQKDPVAAQALQGDVFEALSRVGGSWQSFVPRGNPLGYLATMPASQQGLLASWQRCRRMGWPITFFQCYLAGELRVTELGQPLLELIRDPGPFLPGLGSEGPARHAVVERMRRWGEHALGRMDYAPALASLCSRLQGADAAELSALVGALGELGDPAALPKLSSLNHQPWSWFWGVTDFEAMDRLAHALQPPSDQPLVALFASSRPVQWALGDTFICYPTTLELPAMCQNPSNDSWWIRHGFWQGTGRLPAAEVRAAIATQRRSAAGPDALLDDAVLARDGDDEALQRVLGAVLGSAAPGDAAALTDEPTLDIARALAARLSPTRSDALVKRVLDHRNGSAWTPLMLSLLSAPHPSGVAAELIADYPHAVPAVASAMLRYLAAERTGAGRAFILAQAVIPAGTSVVSDALGLADLQDPLLRSALKALPADAGSVDRATHDLEMFPDAMMHATVILMHAGTASITPEQVARLCAPPTRIRTEHAALERPWQALVLRWLVQSDDARLRAACCTWLGSHMTCDMRPQRVSVLSAVMSVLAVEKDGAAAKAERKLLTDFLAELTESGGGDGDFYHEDVQMGGGLDDVGSISTLDVQTIPALRTALAPPAAKGPAPASNF